MPVFICFLVIIALIVFCSYKYYEMLIDNILNKLVVLDKIFEDRYNDLSRAIAQFQKYLPEEKSLIFDIQRSKADAAKFAKPKTTEELAQKILNENALTINLNFLLDRCDFQKSQPELVECLKLQADYIKKIDATAQEYNKLIETYKTLKQIFPFSFYSNIKHIDLDLETIRTYK